MDNVLAAAQAVMLTTAARWLYMADKVPAPLLAYVPAPGEWSALDCLRHLLDVEVQVFPVRVRAFLAGEDIAAFDPQAQGDPHAGRTPAQLAADFARHRAENLAALEKINALDLARTAQHSELGLVTLGQMLNEWAAHDLAHTIQAERAMMQPFLAGCGPWRESFKDHDAGGDAA